MDRFVVNEIGLQQYRNLLVNQASAFEQVVNANHLYIPAWFSYMLQTKVFGEFLLDFSHVSKEEVLDLVLYSPNKIIPILPGVNLDRYIKHISPIDGSFGYAKLVGFISYYTMLDYLDNTRKTDVINVYLGEGGNINAQEYN